MGLLSRMRERREDKAKEYYNTYYHQVYYPKLQKDDRKEHNCQVELTIKSLLDKTALPDMKNYKSFICEDDKKNAYIFTEGRNTMYEINQRIKVYAKRVRVVELCINENFELSSIPVLWAHRIEDV